MNEKLSHHEHALPGHSHDFWRHESKDRLTAVLVITGSYMIVELVTGFLTHSLALIADAGHMLGDVGGLVLALLAVWFAAKPANADKTYGYFRSEILAGFFNALALVVISIFILIEAYRRFFNPPEVMGLPVLIVAAVGLIMNLVALKVIKKDSAESINIKAAYLEVLADSLANIGVICSSAIILFTHWYFFDPLISGAIGLAILPRTWNLLSECTNILMEGTPGHVNLELLRNAMLAVPGVIDVHDIHVWTITSGLDAMSGHVTIDNRAPAEKVLTEVTRIVNDDFHLRHTTIQVEQIECKGHSNDTCKT